MTPVEREPGRRGRLHGGFYILPSLFTVGTLVCGYYAILSTLRAVSLVPPADTGSDPSQFAFDAAAIAIGWAIVLDGLDGRIARLTNATSDFGRELDSLADVVTFGLAPAFLAFAWGIRPIAQDVGPSLGLHLHQIGWIATFAFVICGAARLARFNIQSARPAGDRRYFVGLPIPGAAGAIAAVIHCRKYAIHDWDYSMVWMAVVLVLGSLMVSQVRYPSFKTLDLRRRRPYAAVILIGVVGYAIWVYSEYTLLVIAIGYVISGPTLRIISRIRPHPPAPREVHAE